jgi:mxaJ protein
MRRRFALVALVCAAVGHLPVPAPAAAPRRVLRVCADPNNLPFSDRHGAGFENQLAELMARELRVEPVYTWWAQRRGFLRSTLGADRCDVVMGVPVGTERYALTRPYYRSGYAFVTRADRDLDIRSLDDPRLRRLRIGVPLVGDDGANPPPVHALARRGIVDNVRGYSVFGDYARESPPLDLIRAVAGGEIDVAIAWGPLAGAGARRAEVPLTVRLVDEPDDDGIPLRFAIAIAVRKDDRALAQQLDRVLVRRHRAIARLLDAAGVPRLAP